MSRARQQDNMAALKAKIFVGGLPPSLTNEALRDFFNKWGPVRESQILVNRDTGRSRGFGFVIYTDAASVSKVIDAGTVDHNSGQIFHKLQGKNVEVKRAFTREQMREQTQPENEAAPADASAGGATGSYDPASYASAAAGAYAAGGGGMPNFVHVGGGHGGPGNPWTSSSLSLAQRLAAPAAFVGRAPPSFQNVAVAGGSAAEPSMARSPSAVILVPGGGAGDQAQAKAGSSLLIDDDDEDASDSAAASLDKFRAPVGAPPVTELNLLRRLRTSSCTSDMYMSTVSDGADLEGSSPLLRSRADSIALNKLPVTLEGAASGVSGGASGGAIGANTAYMAGHVHGSQPIDLTLPQGFVPGVGAGAQMGAPWARGPYHGGADPSTVNMNNMMLQLMQLQALNAQFGPTGVPGLATGVPGAHPGFSGFPGGPQLSQDALVQLLAQQLQMSMGGLGATPFGPPGLWGAAPWMGGGGQPHASHPHISAHPQLPQQQPQQQQSQQPQQPQPQPQQQPQPQPQPQQQPQQQPKRGTPAQTQEVKK